MAKLDNPRRKTFTQTEFEQYPVWVWSDDNGCHQPISEDEPFVEDHETLFIKARFEAGKYFFDGYLIGDSAFYGFGLFLDGCEFVINLNLPDLMEGSLTDIRNLLGDPSFTLFPLRFESPVRLKDGRVIVGTLSV